MQDNITLISLNNEAIKYRIAETHIVNQGESLMVDLQYAVHDHFLDPKLLFISKKELIYVEL
jgi:hypothetical protein